MASNKRVLEGQFTLWKVINVTVNRSFNIAPDFRAAYLTELTDNYDNIAIRCLFENNTTKTRSAIDYAYMTFVAGDVSSAADAGHRVGGDFSSNYGADVNAGSQIYIYYAVLDTEST